jgi:hypothetical protein
MGDENIKWFSYSKQQNSSKYPATSRAEVNKNFKKPQNSSKSPASSRAAVNKNFKKPQNSSKSLPHHQGLRRPKLHIDDARAI